MRHARTAVCNVANYCPVLRMEIWKAMADNITYLQALAQSRVN